MEITFNATGIEEAIKATDPKLVDKAISLWLQRGSNIARRELRRAARKSLKGKVYIKKGGGRPYTWARVGVSGPLAHLIEGGTGQLGDPSFNHAPYRFPSVTGIMRQSGLPKPQAFIVAKTLFEQGGMRPQPFIRPTFNTVQGQLEQLAHDVADEVFNQK